ncbi:MAG TPA: hypothetical protein VL179_06685, partial [Mycobacterium sp.]|nr:hypothetical protein [Mycobacterium sp.]
MTSLLRSAWTAPGAAPPPPRRVGRDWVLVVLVVLVAVLESALRTDLSQPLVAAIIGIGLAPTLLWRRTRPLLMLAISFGTVAVATFLLRDSVPYAGGMVIFTLYALFRWGDGRALVIGSGILIANPVVSALTGTSLGDVIGEVAFLAVVLTLGVALR